MSNVVLSVKNLSVSFATGTGESDAVDNISFDLKEGEVLGLVGESGCGKTATATALMRLLPSRTATVRAERISLNGMDLKDLDEAGMRRIRGCEISMVFQEPLTAMDPAFTIGNQLTAVIRRHRKESRKAAHSLSLGLLNSVGFADAARIMKTYPHQLSGGMRQRIMIVMALACRPRVLLADEPTTALDVTTQAQVLEQLTRLGQQNGTAILLITHDLGIVAQSCDRALVMNRGQIVEQADVAELFAQPSHPYTASLMNAVPRLDTPGPGTRRDASVSKSDTPLLSIRNLRVEHPASGGSPRGVTAVDDVSLEILPAGIYGLVGESGSGKSSLAHSIVQLVRPQSGELLFRGQDLLSMQAGDLSRARRDIQLIFQDPMASLSPRRSILQSLLEPLNHFRIGNPADRHSRAENSLKSVGLQNNIQHRFPHEISGGERQRVALARALVTEPSLIIADEALSSLDVSVRARIIEMILKLREEAGIAFLFVSHDLAVVRQLADTVGVMYLGKILETAPAESLFKEPAHPYTRALLRAVPSPDPGHARPMALVGEPPSPLTPPPGCVFHTRCPEAMERCRRDPPVKTILAKPESSQSSHIVRCHLWNS